MNSEYKTDWFYRELKALGINIDDGQMEQFLLYYNMLIEKNRVMNLTTITEFDEVVRKHFLDSLCIVKAGYDLNGQSILDLGCGAGFPGIPLKIAFPGIKLTLVDSVKKKLKFVDQATDRLGLVDTVTVHGRAEDLARDDKYREQFDICVSRAVAGLPVLSEYALPFVKVGGFFIAYKSDDIEAELDEADPALSLLGGKMKRVIKFSLPGGDEGRSLIIIEKKKATSASYPRRAGVPGKNPLR